MIGLFPVDKDFFLHDLHFQTYFEEWSRPRISTIKLFVHDAWVLCWWIDLCIWVSLFLASSSLQWTDHYSRLSSVTFCCNWSVPSRHCFEGMRLSEAACLFVVTVMIMVTQDTLQHWLRMMHWRMIMKLELFSHLIWVGVGEEQGLQWAPCHRRHSLHSQAHAFKSLAPCPWLATVGPVTTVSGPSSAHQHSVDTGAWSRPQLLHPSPRPVTSSGGQCQKIFYSAWPSCDLILKYQWL